MRQNVTDPRNALFSKTIGRASDPATLAQARLRSSAYFELRALACQSHEGVLAIRGRVSSFYLKQLAHAAVRDVPGVEEIQNQVQVGRTNPDRR